MPDEKREARRVRTDPINVKINCHVGTIPGYISNLSERGARVHIEQELTDPELILIVPMISENDPPLELKCQKIRVEKDKDFSLNVMALQFTGTSTEDLVKLQTLMDYYQKKKGV